MYTVGLIETRRSRPSGWLQAPSPVQKPRHRKRVRELDRFTRAAATDSKNPSRPAPYKRQTNRCNPTNPESPFAMQPTATTLSRRRFPLRAARRIRVRAWPGGGRRMDTRESAPAVRNHRPTGDDTMQMATTLRRSTHTFLTHLFGPGLDDDRYVIERFQSKADGEIRPRGRNGSSKKGRGKASREIVSLSTVQRMRPERDEIIICTGVNRTTLGVQYWGDRAVGLFVERASIADPRSPGTSRPRLAGRTSFARTTTAEGRNMPYKDPKKERTCGRRRYERITAERIARGMCPRCGKARSPRPTAALCQCTAAKSVARPSAQDAPGPRRPAFFTAGRDAGTVPQEFARDRSRRRDRARREARTVHALWRKASSPWKGARCANRATW